MRIMDADTETIIWNRAATAGGPTPRRGDTALSAALRLHAMVMSGGLDHALDVLTAEEFASAADGFRYLRLGDVAELVEHAHDAAGDDDLLEKLEDRYSALIPCDHVIGDQFDAYYGNVPTTSHPRADEPATRLGQVRRRGCPTRSALTRHRRSATASSRPRGAGACSLPWAK